MISVAVRVGAVPAFLPSTTSIAWALSSITCEKLSHRGSCAWVMCRLACMSAMRCSTFSRWPPADGSAAAAFVVGGATGAVVSLAAHAATGRLSTAARIAEVMWFVVMDRMIGGLILWGEMEMEVVVGRSVAVI